MRVAKESRIGHIEGLIEGANTSETGATEEQGIVYTTYNGVSSYRGVHTHSAEARFGFSSLLLGTRTDESSYFAKKSTIDGSDRDDDIQAERTPWLAQGDTQAGSATDFADRKSDFLIPGEKIKIVAINRKTGYIGTLVTALGSPEQQQTSMDTPDEQGSLERKLILYPPNLKINVTRDYSIKEGLYKHDNDEKDRRYLIGSEGAGLTSDTAIAIQTQWLDNNGAPLPDKLPGYTARIAISTGTGTEGISELFDVKPGIHTGVIQLPGNLATAAKHYYVQLVGETKDGNPNFGSNGAGEGKLATRPKYYVPVLVPLLNEAETRRQENILRDAKAEGSADPNDKVNPIYDWVYRPEMMFSVYDWKVQQIFRTHMENAEIENIINLDEPVIHVTDIVDVFATLMEQAEPELPRFSGDRELILAIGEQEIQVTVNDNVITFNDVSHLAELAVEDYVTLSLYQNNDSANVLWEYAFALERLMLADFNRDGKIEFNRELRDAANRRTDTVTEDKPFVFWINDDDDDQTSEVKSDNTVDTPGAHDTFLGLFGQFDYENDFIDGTRDLIDFAAVGVKLHKFISTTPNAENFTYKLKHADSAVNIVYTEMAFDNADQYLKELNGNNYTTVFGSWQNANTLAEVPVHKVDSTGIDLPSDFITLIKNNKNKGIFLAEFNKATTQPLELVVTDADNNEVLNAKMYLRIDVVEELYLRASLRDITSEAGSTAWNGTPTNVNGILDQWNQDKNILTDKVSDLVDMNKNFIFIHGCCNDVDQARAFQSETYKRLYHAGSNAVFTGIHWRGNEGLNGGGNYWGAVENALNSADDTAAFINGITGTKAIAAHSLGNMVAGSAFADFGMNADQYFMLNPAVAIEAYDAGQLEARNMRHTDWDNFYFGTNDNSYSDPKGRRLWSTEWYSLFPQGDHRNNLTWRGRFSSMLSRTNVTQFYSSGEEVLRAANEGVPSSLTPLAGDSWLLGLFFDSNLPSGSDAWNIQEKSKGRSNLAALVAGNSAGGWGFREIETNDPDCSVDYGATCTTALFGQTRARNITDDEQRTNPFFKAFQNIGISDPITGSENARISHPHVLGYEMPALSFAAGGTRMTRPELPIARTDMNTIMQGWPQERIDEFGQARWFHSDFKDVAYRYTYPVFNEMVNRGNLR